MELMLHETGDQAKLMSTAELQGARVRLHAQCDHAEAQLRVSGKVRAWTEVSTESEISTYGRQQYDEASRQVGVWTTCLTKVEEELEQREETNQLALETVVNHLYDAYTILGRQGYYSLSEQCEALQKEAGDLLRKANRTETQATSEQAEERNPFDVD